MKKPTMHVISHSHWDREWYMSFEEHRARLVELMDDLITVMEEHEDFRYFHLDGQMIVIEDYLQIKPYMKPRLDALIRAGRIQVGPWYILQDEYLTSGESNVRNLLEGLRICEENGYDPVMTGYFPDAFGNVSQIPQLLSGFGIDNAVFGRGVWAILFDNRPDDKAGAKELNWHGADGSTIIGAMFTNWYNNANELPVEEAEVQKTYGNLLESLKNASVTPHWLAMNGCDHQPVQLDLPQSMAEARRQFGEDVEIVHSNFKDYIKALRPYRETFADVYGELTGQMTSGNCQLVDTASTHIPLKQQNHATQNLLTRQAEPMSCMAALYGDPVRKDLLRYSWKTLMQNHPHDSICCCSCDAVTREMNTRFDKAYQSGEYVRNEAGRYLAEHMDTASFDGEHVVVVHTTPMAAERVLTATVYLKEYQAPEQLWLADGQGNAVSAAVTYLGEKFTYTLPKRKFRQVTYQHAYEIHFRCKAEGMGCYAYTLRTGNVPTLESDLRLLDGGMENRFLRVHIREDGTLDVQNRQTGRLFTGLNRMQDRGDRGESYNFIPTEDAPIFPSARAEWKLVRADELGITYEIVYHMAIPVALAEDGKRSEACIDHAIVSRVTLEAGSRYLSVETTIRNESENHCMQVLFPNDMQTDTSMADSQFDVLRRPIQPWEGWENPVNTQRMESLFALEDGKDGLLVAGKGLHSYEIWRDGSNTMALTLLRAVGEVGDWGVFPAPDLQMKRELTLEYAILPYGAEDKAAAFAAAHDYAGADFFVTQTGSHPGSIPANTLLLRVEGEHLAFSALKAAEDGTGMVLRLCNLSEQTQPVCLKLAQMQDVEVCETDLREREVQKLPVEENTVRFQLGSKKIWTGKLTSRKNG